MKPTTAALNAPTFEDHLREATALVVLIITATSGEEDWIPVGRDAVREAIHEAALRAYRVLDRLQDCPGPIANWTPAPDDERAG